MSQTSHIGIGFAVAGALAALVWLPSRAAVVDTEEPIGSATGVADGLPVMG